MYSLWCLCFLGGVSLWLELYYIPCYAVLLTVEERAAWNATLPPLTRYSDDSPTVIAGVCRACAWNKKYHSTPVMAGHGVQFLRHKWYEEGFNLRSEIHLAVLDGLTYDTLHAVVGKHVVLPSLPLRPPVADVFNKETYLGNWKAPYFDCTPPVRQAHQQPLHQSSVPFLGSIQHRSSVNVLDNRVAPTTKLPNDPWWRTSVTETADFRPETDQQLPFRTVATGQVDLLGASHVQDTTYFVPQLLQTQHILYTPNTRYSGTETLLFGSNTSTSTPHRQLPANPFTSGFYLWCAPHLMCDSGDRATGVCAGLGASTLTCDSQGGVITTTGQCHCHQDRVGTSCEVTRPEDFFPHNATACPTTFDLCSGRGVCVTLSELLGEDTVVGVTCRCKTGFFGGTFENLLTFTHQEMVDLYASSLFCRAGSTGWQDPTGWTDSYPYFHQCLLYDGVYQPTGWTVDSVTPGVPVAPWGCLDQRGTGGSLYGGIDCARCPDCQELGVRTESCDHSPQRWDTSSPPVCLCKTNYHGSRCQYQRCPSDSTGVCGEHVGRGHCVFEDHDARAADHFGTHVNGRPFTPWNSSYTGRCQCHRGWGLGPQGLCDVPLCPTNTLGTMCGHSDARCNLTTCEQTENITLAVDQVCITRCVSNQCYGDFNSSTHSSLRVCCLAMEHCPSSTYTFVHQESCADTEGVCVCPRGFLPDEAGLCTRRACPISSVNGEMCHNLTIQQVGHPRFGESVCDFDTRTPTCQCWLQFPGVLPPTGDTLLAGFINGPETTDCSVSVSELLSMPSSQRATTASHVFEPCYGIGTAVLTHCHPELSYRSCSPESRYLVSCECPQGAHGRYCENTDCPEPSDGSCSPAGVSVNVTAYCNPANKHCELPNHSALYNAPDYVYCGLNYAMSAGNCDPLDQCVQTGGIARNLNICDCGTYGLLLTPSPGQALPGQANQCVKPCVKGSIALPSGVALHECGALYEDGSTRCEYVSGHAVGNSSCDCTTSQSVNPITQELMPWITDGAGSCQPRCLHCSYNATTDSCDNTTCTQEVDGICQYGGVACDEPLCSSAFSHHLPLRSRYNGTACVCQPQWLYVRADGRRIEDWPGNTDTTCGYTWCEATGGSLPENVDNTHCTCPLPLAVNTDPLAADYGLCIDPCAPHGVANTTSGLCECEAAWTGGRCKDTLCDPVTSTIAENNTHCVCLLPQFGGTFCTEDLCVHGVSAGNTVAGCTCVSPYKGTLCEVEDCNDHGTVVGETCVCDAGWFGTHCELSKCWLSDFNIQPLACADVPQECVNETLGYHCRCGAAATFDHSDTGTCVLHASAVSMVAAQRGVMVRGTNATLTVLCALGYNGTFCEDDVCGNNGTGPNTHQYVDFTTTLSDVSEDPLGSEVLQQQARQECRCAFPFYEVSSGCAKVNCSLLNQPLTELSSIYRPFVQLTDTTCGCEDTWDRVEPYNPVVHDFRLSNTTLQTLWDSVHYHVSATAPTPLYLLCARNCHRYFTRHVSDQGECQCWDGYDGALCNQSNPAAVYTPLYEAPAPTITEVEETRLNEPLMITVIILTVAIMCLFIAAALALWAPGFGGAWHPSYHRVSKKEI